MSDLDYKNNLEAERSKDSSLSKAKNLGKAVGSGLGQLKMAMSFRKKLERHKMIIIASLIFDLVALVPFLSVLVNFAFAGILFLYFGSKSKPGESAGLLGIVLPTFIGSIVDWFLSILPVNLGTTLIRIALSKEEEGGEAPQEESAE